MAATNEFNFALIAARTPVYNFGSDVKLTSFPSAGKLPSVSPEDPVKVLSDKIANSMHIPISDEGKALV